MNLEFIEFELDWPSDLSVIDLRNYILSNLTTYGKPIRWAITSLNTHSGTITQKIHIEAVFLIGEDKKNAFNTDLN